MLARGEKKSHRHFSKQRVGRIRLALGYPNGILVHRLNHSAKLQELQLPNRFPVVVQWLVLFIVAAATPVQIRVKAAFCCRATGT